MVELFANSRDPAASDLGLHCLPVTLLGVSQLQWVNEEYFDGISKIIFSSSP